MKSMKNIKESIKSSINKLIEKTEAKAPPKVPADYKIKYDGSDKELEILGFVDEVGNVINYNRNEYNMYLKEVGRRKELRASGNMPRLVAQGIIAEDGEILDKKGWAAYEAEQLDLKIKLSSQGRIL